MTQSDYLLISRGQWDETASPQDVQAAIDRFYAWYERGLADGVLKSGSRLEMRGKRVTRDGITDGPFAEAKELVGGYWFIVATSLDEAASLAQRQARVRAVLRTLPPDQLEVVTLAFIDGLSHSEIADKLGLPLGTVKSRIRLAYQKVRAELEDLQ